MKICIDAGHNYSGVDTGAGGNGLYEQNVTFNIANRVKALLESKGIGVIMTRESLTSNVGSSLSESINKRVSIANGSKCDLFVSIHCNAGGGEGTEMLVYSLGTEAESLAATVLEKITSKLRTNNRGVKVRKNLGVLKYTKMPAILVETAFIDNVSDAEKLKNNYNEFAEAIADGILSHIGTGGITDEPSEIIDKLSGRIKINDREGAEKALLKAKEENSSLYWILYKLVNGGVI